MKCILKTYFRFLSGSQNLLEKSFANCAVLKLLFQGDTVTIDVIWEGGTRREQVGGEKDYARFSQAGTYHYSSTMMPPGQIVYMVRHGEGVHNVAKEQGTKWRNFNLTDAQLTPAGILQAELAGEALLQDAGDEQLIAFVSDLRRTHQTAEAALPHLQHYYVLPCLFELAGGCDGDLINLLPSQENTSLRRLPPGSKVSYATNPNPSRRSDNCTTANVFALALQATSTVSEPIQATRGGKKYSRRHMGRSHKRSKGRRRRTQRGGFSWDARTWFSTPTADTPQDECSPQILQNLQSKPNQSEYITLKAKCDAKRSKKSWWSSLFSPSPEAPKDNILESSKPEADYTKILTNPNMPQSLISGSMRPSNLPNKSWSSDFSSNEPKSLLGGRRRRTRRRK